MFCGPPCLFRPNTFMHSLAYGLGCVCTLKRCVPYTGINSLASFFARELSLLRQRCLEWTRDKLAAVFSEKPDFTKKWQAEGISRTLPQLTLIFCISICFKPRGNNGGEETQLWLSWNTIKSLTALFFLIFYEKKSVFIMQSC